MNTVIDGFKVEVVYMKHLGRTNCFIQHGTHSSSLGILEHYGYIQSVDEDVLKVDQKTIDKIYKFACSNGYQSLSKS